MGSFPRLTTRARYGCRVFLIETALAQRAFCCRTSVPSLQSAFSYNFRIADQRGRRTLVNRFAILAFYRCEGMALISPRLVGP